MGYSLIYIVNNNVIGRMPSFMQDNLSVRRKIQLSIICLCLKQNSMSIVIELIE